MEETNSNNGAQNVQNDQQIVKKIITTEEIISPTPQKEPEKKLPEVIRADFLGIEIRTDSLSEEAKTIMSEICEFDRISEIVANELSELNEKEFPEKAALVGSLTNDIDLESIKKAYDLLPREQAAVMACFFKAWNRLFEAIKGSKQSNANSWFTAISDNMLNLFGDAEDQRIDVVDSKKIFADSMSACLAFGKAIQKKEKKLNRADAAAMKTKIKAAISEMKNIPDKDFVKEVKQGMKDVYARERGKDLQTFADTEIVTIVDKADTLYKRCDELFEKLQIEMRNSIQKFMLPAMKTCMLATPVQQLAEAKETLRKMVDNHLKYGTGAFIMNGLNNDLQDFQSSLNKATALINMGNQNAASLRKVMPSLDNLGQEISKLSAQHGLFVNNLKAALKAGNITNVVRILVNNSELDMGLFNGYMTWWKELEVFSFKNTSQKLLAIFQQQS